MNASLGEGLDEELTFVNRSSGGRHFKCAFCTWNGILNGTRAQTSLDQLRIESSVLPLIGEQTYSKETFFALR